MTYNKTNTTIVIAFAAIMLAWPLANPNAYADEIDANMDDTCGFTTTNLAGLNFGTFDPTDSESGNALEQEVQLEPVADTSASARVQVTVEDWFGVGTRSSATMTLVGVADTEEIILGGNTYTAVTTGTTGANFDIGGDDAADAREFAVAVRATDAATFNISTIGTNIATIEVIARGTSGDGTTLSTDSVSSTAGTFAGASNTPQLIMDGETTKFDMNVGSTATDSYANKVGVITLGTSQEVLGGTDPDLDIYFALEIDPATATYNAAAFPYDGPLTQEITVTVESACDGTAP